MSTHELARALQTVAKLLRSMPEMDLREWVDDSQYRHRSGRKGIDPDKQVNIFSLLAISRVSKSEWHDLIRAWNLPLDVSSKDSARNIMGDVMRYLAAHPDDVQRLQRGISKESKASPALMKALSLLMASDNNANP